MISEFDRSNLATIRSDIDGALKAVADKHGISLAIGNIRYGNGEARTKLTMCTTVQSNAVPSDGQTTVEKAMDTFATSRGLPVGLYGKTIMFGGTPYKITGFNPRRRVSPFSVEGPRGGMYKLSVQQIIDSM